MFITKSQLKSHLNITPDDIEFDAQLPRLINAAEGKVKSFLDRNVLEELPETPENESDIAVSDEIRLAILDVAAYFFDAKGSIDADMVHNMLEAYIGHLRYRIST